MVFGLIDGSLRRTDLMYGQSVLQRDLVSKALLNKVIVKPQTELNKAPEQLLVA